MAAPTAVAERLGRHSRGGGTRGGQW